MHLSFGSYHTLFGVYIRLQHVKVALLAVPRLAPTALQLWSLQLLHQFVNAVSATDAPPLRLPQLAAPSRAVRSGTRGW